MTAVAPERLALLDHHVHGVVTAELDRAAFELLMSESGLPAPIGTSHFDAPIGLAIRRACAPVLDLDAHAEPDAYLERRAALGPAEVNRRLLRGAELELLLVETGHRTGEVAGPPEMAELSSAPAAEIVRVEAVAEAVAAHCDGTSGWLATMPEALAGAAAGAAGLKTIVAYRCGLDLAAELPDAATVRRSLDRWFAARDAHEGGRASLRLEDPVLLAAVLHHALDLAGERGLPLQVHAGFGDADLDLHRADPAVFTPWVRRAHGLGVAVVFLHCYPYHRQAGYLAEVFPNVFFDVGCILNYAGPSARRVLAEALELAPFTKMLYSSDAFGLAELAYLGAVQFRRSLAAVLDSFVAAGECNAADAERIGHLIGTDNARRLYPLDRAVWHQPGAAAGMGLGGGSAVDDG